MAGIAHELAAGVLVAREGQEEENRQNQGEDPSAAPADTPAYLVQELGGAKQEQREESGTAKAQFGNSTAVHYRKHQQEDCHRLQHF